MAANASPQGDLFPLPPRAPEGFRYRPALIGALDARDLLRALEGLDFRPFEFQGRLALREVVGFGWRYDYGERRLRAAAPMPEFLLPLRARVAALAGREPEAFEQVLINAYKPGAGIGWHRDKAQFGDVAGISLGASCLLRFRRRTAEGWERRTIELAPRSAYLLSGQARRGFEHSIPPVSETRYSVTFRTLAAGAGGTT